MVGKFARPRTVENLPHLVSLLISNTDQHQVRRRCTLQLDEELLLVISTTKQAPFWMFLFFRYVRYICYIICTNAKMPLRPDLRTRRGEKYEYEYAKYNIKAALWGLIRL